MAAGLKFAIETLGCKTNLVESDAVADLLMRHGYERVSFDDAADAYIINTCTVTQAGDRKSRQLIRRARKLSPHATVVVMGCYSQIAPEEVAAMDGVDVVLGTTNRASVLQWLDARATRPDEYPGGSVTMPIDPMPQALAAADVLPVLPAQPAKPKLPVLPAQTTPSAVVAVSDIMSVTDFEDIPLYHAPGHTRAFLKIQEGCEQYCTYCIIPYARGKVRSRSLESIVEEARRLVAQGFAEFVLTGIHIGSYGRDMAQNITLVDVIEQLSELHGVKRIRLGSIEPGTVDETFIERLSSNTKLCDHFHLSLQSGCDEVLRRMNRKYRTAEYRLAVARLRSIFPDPAITTDLIVGFPGETEDQFLESLAFVQEIGFSDVHVFPYSQRRGTPAAVMRGQVEADVKKHRSERMRAVVQALSDAYMARCEQTASPILVESIEAGDAVIASGYTTNYLYRSRVLDGDAGYRVKIGDIL